MIEDDRANLAPGQTLPATIGPVAPFLFAAYLVAKPFYFFPSGGPQIADAIAGLLFLIIFLGRQSISRGTAPVMWACVLFSTYTLIVNAVWTLLMMDINMLVTPAFYFFNTIVVYAILSLHGRIGDRLLKVTLVACVVSVAVQVVLSVWAIHAGAERQALFFNNENQLGYWSLLSATIFCIVARQTNMRFLYQAPFLALAFYLVALSLSKGALVAVFLLLAIHFSRNFGQFVLVSIVGIVAVFLASDLSLLEHVGDRLLNIGGESDDSLHGRGYDRIWLHPQYLLFGAGEFGLSRFPETTIELHSTLGTVVFSYGAIGVFLFGLVLWRLFKLAGWREMLYLVPAFAHGLAHQGLRFTLLWVLFAVIAIVGASASARRARQGIAAIPEGPNQAASIARFTSSSVFRAGS